MKYSKEKLVALALCNSRTGYSSQPNSTTLSPLTHVKNCVIKKMKDAWAAFPFGINAMDMKLINHMPASNILSIKYIRHAPVRRPVFFENHVI